MKGSKDPAGERLWAIVTATVRPLGGHRMTPSLPPVSPARTPAPVGPRAGHTGTAPPARRPALPATRAPDPIEPGRMRRLHAQKDLVRARIDLHGLTQDGARAALTAFILRGVESGVRTILVITGKGALGDGILRRRVPDWLAEPPLRAVVAGVSEAHRRHGGAGALYVALKRAASR